MDRSKWPARAVLPVAQPGLIFIFIPALAAGVFFYLGWGIPAWACAILALFVCWFFRDPNRQIPDSDNSLVSPADGKVIIVEHLQTSEFLAEPCLKISIFMNVFNVHVNRIPFSGVIKQVIYRPGKFMNASFDKASVHNERNALIIETSEKVRFAVVQIAGLIARRIVNCAKEGETFQKGDRYGLIRFGSRLDLYLPPDFDPKVQVGDKTTAGSTIMGYMKK